MDKIKKLSDKTYMVGDMYVDFVPLDLWADAGGNGATIHGRRSTVYLLYNCCHYYREDADSFSYALDKIDKIKKMGYKF